MEFGRNSALYMAICILVLFTRTSHALDCYTCNVSTSTADEDGCDGIGSLKKCPSNSVCLAASYEIYTGGVNTFTNMQSCFPNMADKECEYFIKSQRDLQRTGMVTPTTCYSCKADNCNKGKFSHGIASKGEFVPVLVGVLSLFAVNCIVNY